VTSRSATAALVKKELRELLPLWSVTMAGLVFVALSADVAPALLFGLPGAILAAFAPFALGAMAMGHEYRHGTMTTLLTLPVGRDRALTVKAVVLGSLLVVAVAVAWWIGGARTPWLWMPLACGFCLAPWFTLMTRSELAGMVFAGAVPALFLLAAEVSAEAVYGPALETRDLAGQLRNLVFGTGTAAMCTVAVVGTITRFRSLEIVEGHRSVVSTAWPAVTRTNTIRRPENVYVALAMKELRLQTLPASVAALLLVLALMLAWLPDAADPYGAIERTASVLQPLFALLVAILSGALASAEERHAGTWTSQVLLPVPLWKQWAVKVAVVTSFALGAGVLLSGVMASTFPMGRWPYPMNLLSMPAITVIAAGVSLYISSLCQRGVTAFLVASGAFVAIAFCSMVFLRQLGTSVFFFPRLVLRPMIAAFGVTEAAGEAFAWVLTVLGPAGAIGISSKYALDNHRRVSTTPRTVIEQVVVIALVGALALTARVGAQGFVDAVMWHNRVEMRKVASPAE
jgi:hypothetical protein